MKTKKNLQPEIQFISEKKLAGKRLMMSLTEDKTQELWQSFMPFRNGIKGRINSELISLQIYPADYFNSFQPDKKFEKWAVAEISDFENLPENLELLILPAGMYAVFLHKGMSTDIFHYIFSDWLPNSHFAIDSRPHFEVLGEKYKHGCNDSEEEIWIPIKSKKM